MKITTNRFKKAFALVVTLSLMVLLTIVAVGLLGLSTISLRATSQSMAQSVAQANARLALMIAIGELQKEMGPDQRISAESAIFDTSPDNPARIEGVEQSRWLATYDAWGNWLNTSYQRPGGGGSLAIGQTYTPRRPQMFRRWLLSLPDGDELRTQAPDSIAGWIDKSVVMVGEGSLGTAAAVANPDQVTRAYLKPVKAPGGDGNYAWWISPENHRAKINVVTDKGNLAASELETSHGNAGEVAVSLIDGFGGIGETPLQRDKLITTATIETAGVESSLARGSFFDLTARSQGVLASVRTGHLKKDLSLLFERPENQLPAPYRFNSGAAQEPSIRPMSPDLLANGPQVTSRHFQSWTNLRHFYRMYRNSSDATPGQTGASGALEWSGSRPFSRAHTNLLHRDSSNADQWHGQNAYQRLPILAKLTFIYSLMTERVNPNDPNNQQHRLYLVYTPVFTYWNPYNTELRVPDNTLGSLSSTYQVLPMRSQFYLNTTPQNVAGDLSTSNAHSFLRSGGRGDIIFKPGELKLFSHTRIGLQGDQNAPEDLAPGFDPLAYGGDKRAIGSNYSPSQNPGLAVEFSHSVWGGNVSYGNTPGSLNHTPFWLPASGARNQAFQYNIPVMYQNDWFNLAQTYTPLTPPGVGELARWSFTDSSPVPVAYAQLVLKGLSEFDYDSISWARDWRSRNWLHSPPFYFGSALYMSEDSTIAHTQRIDSPYVMNFGPLSQAELPKVVFHSGGSAFFGSGSSPFEKVNAVPALELPTAPVGSLAGFSGMRINPGWADPRVMNRALSIEATGGNNTSKASLFYALAKTTAYQSGVTGPGIGNSFMHPMLPRTGVYKFFNNSVSADPADRGQPLVNINYNDNKVFSDYWDHTLLLNDALWDDYFTSSLADQSRPGASNPASLQTNLNRLVADETSANSRYHYHSGGLSPSQVVADLSATDGYLKAAGHLMADGMFNVNSTSARAWYALFAGIRERKLVYRNAQGALQPVNIPSGKTIAISRFNTPTSDLEMTDPGSGVRRDDGANAWSDVRFLDDRQLLKLAEECVKQVKLRGPFLNYSEFINRRLSNDALGLTGALQSAIDYDDANPDSGSINYNLKNGPDFRMSASSLGRTSFSTPQALEGSRFAGIPGYVIQSDILKPIGNTLAVRDDTFRIRAYGESLGAGGKVLARVWCEAILQRTPEYLDPSDKPETPAGEIRPNGEIVRSNALNTANARFGRRFQMIEFRWLNSNEI